MPRPVVVLSEALPGAGMDLLASRADLRLAVAASASEAALWPLLPEATAVVLVNEAPALGAAMIERAGSLRLACRNGAGYDNFDVAALTRRRIPLATTGDANADAVAEHALYLLLALFKNGPAHDRAVRSGRWSRGIGGRELAGKTCAVVGYGRIGRRIARLAAAFAMRVMVVEPRLPDELASADGFETRTLAAALAEADALCLALPLGPSTRGLIGREALARMKPGAVLVNVARGPIVDQAALVEALAAGRLAGAGLDVLEQEPPAPADPLLALDTVVLTPHTAASCPEAVDRVAVACARIVLDFLDGRLDPAAVVNREVLAPAG